MSKTKIEPYYQREAKQFVDMLFDSKIINPDFSRDDLQTVEDYHAYLLQSNAETSAKTAVMLAKLKK